MGRGIVILYERISICSRYCAKNRASCLTARNTSRILGQLTRKEKILSRVLCGNPAAIRFSEFQAALRLAGFSHDRTTGIHEIWINRETDQSMNIQPRPKDKTMAKPYQIREFRWIV